MKDDTTEQAILQAAQAEFAQKEFHGAPMQTIAKMVDDMITWLSVVFLLCPISWRIRQTRWVNGHVD